MAKEAKAMKQYRNVTFFKTGQVGHTGKLVTRSCFRITLLAGDYSESKYALSSQRILSNQIDHLIDELGATVQDGDVIVRPENVQSFNTPLLSATPEQSLSLLDGFLFFLPITTPVCEAK
jgi:hypothetical protein